MPVFWRFPESLPRTGPDDPYKRNKRYLSVHTIYR